MSCFFPNNELAIDGSGDHGLVVLADTHTGDFGFMAVVAPALAPVPIVPRLDGAIVAC